MALLIASTVFFAALLGGAPSWALSEGDRAPSVRWASLEPGRAEVALSDLGGRVVVVDFWASWCPPCVAQLEALDRLLAARPGSDLLVVAVSIDDEASTARRYLERKFPNARFRSVHDPGGTAMAAFGADGIPALYVLDRAGVVRATHFGPGGAEDLEARLASLLGAGTGASARDHRTVD